MEDKKMFGSEFTMNDPSEYTLEGNMVAPDGFVHNVIYHKQKDKYGYIVKQRYSDDKSFYGPYILHKIGQKVGIKTPETELGLFIMLEEGEYRYRDSFFDSACVFLENSSKYNFLNEVSYIKPEVAFEIFANSNTEKNNENVIEKRRNHIPLTVDEHIDSIIFMLKTRGEKTESEYTQEEIDKMRQDVIDRIVLGLKLGIKGETDIITYNDKHARLSPYYLASHNMFALNIRKEWIEKQLLKHDEEFKEVMNSEFPSQYTINNKNKATATEVLKYLFEKYPAETEKAYNKVKSYTRNDLAEELESYTLLDENHRKFALKVFKERDREFEQVYNEYSKNIER